MPFAHSTTRKLQSLAWVAFLTMLVVVGHVCAEEPGTARVNVDVMLLIDNSHSMIGTDPESLRIQAAKFLVDYLRANAETLGANYRIGVISFGGVVSDTIPLRLFPNDTIRDSIRPEDIPYTDFKGALATAVRELGTKSFRTGNKMAVIMFTDGRPQLNDAAMTEAELKEYFQDMAPLVSELASEKVPLFVLGTGDAQKDRDNWTSLGLGVNYVPINSATDLSEVYHDIVAGLIGSAASKAEVLQSSVEQAIDVEPYLEHIVFSFIRSDPTAHITLTAPDGTIVQPTQGGKTSVHHVIYGISNPSNGRWKVQFEGEGKVHYWVDRQYSTVVVSTNASFPYSTQPISITAFVVRNGSIVTQPLEMKAQIELPTGISVTIPLRPLNDGRYESALTAMGSGTYTVTANVSSGGLVLPVRQVPAHVAMLPLPLLPTFTPQPTPTPTSSPAPTSTASPSPTRTSTPTASLTPTPTATAQPVTAVTKPEPKLFGIAEAVLILPWTLLVLAVTVLILLIFKVKLPVADVTDGLRKTVALLESTHDWKTADIEALKRNLDEVEKAGLGRAERVIEKLSEVLETCGQNTTLLVDIYGRACQGRQIEQRALAKALLGSGNMGMVYTYCSVLSWPDAIRYAIGALAERDRTIDRSMIKVWESCWKLLSLDDDVDLGEARLGFEELKWCLAQADANSNGEGHLKETFKFYNDLWVHLGQPCSDSAQVTCPPDVCLPYLKSYLYEKLRLIVSACTTEKLDELEHNLKSDLALGLVSRVDYLGLGCLIGKYRRWVEEGKR